MKKRKDYFRGCLLGGATADAKAYGIHEGGLDLISDNSQLASFTVDGLVWADQRAKRKGVYAYIPCLFYAYQKWYYTQTGSLADKSYGFILEGEILKWEELFARRGEGTTSLNALGGSIGNKFGSLQNRINTSKGCGAVMRSAPIGMYFSTDEKMAFKVACDGAALTHGHIDAILSAGYFAYLISGILQDGEIFDVANAALGEMRKYQDHETCCNAIERALKLAADKSMPHEIAMAEMGQGFTGDEVMALSLYCALRYRDDFEEAVHVTSAYRGNRNSISTICGHILGAYHGVLDLPYNWIKNLELSELFIIGADRLLEAVTGESEEGQAG